MTKRQRIGFLGQRVARRYLAKLGFELVGRNIRVGRGELDLVFKLDGIIVFVEVKTRVGDSWRLFDSLSAEQERTIAKTAALFLKERSRRKLDYRFDRVGVSLDERSLATREIVHFTAQTGEGVPTRVAGRK